LEQFQVKYNFEYERKLKACFIAAGGHSFRNVYPTFQYAPVNLVAICDVNGERVAAYARRFGASRHYTDHREMLEKEQPEVVFIVTAYHPDGRVQATDLAIDALKSGSHVWMEKPTASSIQEVEKLMEASTRYNRYVMTGLKKIFFPALEKLNKSLPHRNLGDLHLCIYAIHRTCLKCQHVRISPNSPVCWIIFFIRVQLLTI
jgi:predicted dehydrogenase